jgi:ribosomal protein S12 methylthiotransferase
VFVCRSEFESPEVDGEILVKYDASVMGDVDPYSLIGDFIKVRVTGADEYDLIAEPLEI